VYIPVTIQQKRVPAGRAPIFCPVCRQLRAADAVHLHQELVAFIFLSLWRWGRHAELTCPTCRASFPAPADYPCTAHAPPEVDPIDLLAEADDELLEALTARDELEQRRLSGRLAPLERDQLLTEPFRDFQHRASEVMHGRIPTVAGIAIILLLLAIPITIAIFMNAKDVWPPLIALLVCIILAAIVATDFAYFEPRRARSSVYTHLAASLAPLTPSDQELTSLLTQLRSERNALARKIRLSTLRRYLNRASLDPRVTAQPNAIA
jgi:hypothetical protein